jgi:hypothetical protein
LGIFQEGGANFCVWKEQALLNSNVRTDCEHLKKVPGDLFSREAEKFTAKPTPKKNNF